MKFLLGISFVLLFLVGCRQHIEPSAHYDIVLCTHQGCTMYEYATVVDIRGDVLVFKDENGVEYKSIDDWKIMAGGGKIIFENPRFTNGNH